MEKIVTKLIKPNKIKYYYAVFLVQTNKEITLIGKRMDYFPLDATIENSVVLFFKEITKTQYNKQAFTISVTI